MWTGFTWLTGYDAVAGFCGHGNKYVEIFSSSWEILISAISYSVEIFG
jgi:hypothetical protein